MQSQTEAMEGFWAWFRTNAARMQKAHAEARDADSSEVMEIIHPILEEVMTALHAYDDRLFPYFGQNEVGDWELIITAEGKAEAFDSATDLVARAPALSGWRIIALKPRETLDAGQFLFEDLGIDPATTRFIIESEGGKAVIYLIFEEWDDEREEELHGASCLLLDTMLGERDMAEKVAHVVCGPVAGLKPGLDLRPLLDLPARFDAVVNN